MNPQEKQIAAALEDLGAPKPLFDGSAIISGSFAVFFIDIMENSHGAGDPKPERKFVAEKARSHKDFQCFFIYETEWADPAKRNLWISMLQNKLGFAKEKIFARKCSAAEIPPNLGFLAKGFFEKSHIQGSCLSSVKLGLFHEGELVSCMAFGKPRFSKKRDWELIRFASKPFCNVIGAASKLLKLFLDSHPGESVASYCNLRWGWKENEKDLYSKLGFSFAGDSGPNYGYFRPEEKVIRARIQYQAHKLPKVLEIYDPEKTESENCFANGLRRIWDAGNKTYELVPPAKAEKAELGRWF
jgi:hypothetical protein